MKTNDEMDLLIARFLAGEASPEDAMELEDWKKRSTANQAHFEKSARVFDLIMPSPSTDKAWNKFQSNLKKDIPVRKLWTSGWRLAASIVALCCIGGLAIYILSNEETLNYATARNQLAVHLNDGTDVQVKSNSEITLAEGFGRSNRNVKLKGSAYFTVTHSEQLPFVIETGPIHIQDLGTKFDVKTTKDTIYIRVDEGSVLIYDQKGIKLKLSASESAYYVISTGLMQVEISVGNTPAVRQFSFNNQRLETVLQQLKSVYQAEINLSDEGLNNCRLTTQFADEPLDLVLSVITETLGFELEEENGAYLIIGKPCEP